ncbi:MAG: Eco57I restriction-modification methylase domain-containing protein, partial [Candidatus Helarchaeota archaeon]
VVDEKVDENEDNWNIEPLPNLEFKFVAANSLIGLSDSQQYDLEDQEYIERLRKLRDEYFISYGKEKKKIENEFTKLQEKLFEHTVGWQKKRGKAYDLAKWEPFKGESSPWFDPGWMFGIENGFDIAMANPPYVRVDDINTVDKSKYKEIFTTATGKYDLYYLFFENALKMISNSGSLVFISPNKYCAATSAQALRELLLKEVESAEIVSTSRLPVFDASNYPVISVYNKKFVGHGVITIRQAKKLNDLADQTPDSGYISEKNIIAKIPISVFPINISSNEFGIIKKVLPASIKFGELFTISEGLRIPTEMEKQRVSNKEIVKQYQFERYSEIRAGSFISEKNLLNLISESSGRFIKIQKEKILIAEDALRINATLDTEKRVPQGGVYFGISKSEIIDLKFILGLLNSAILSFLYEVLYAGMHMGGGYLRYRSIFLENLPIPESISGFSISDQSEIIKAVDNILSIKKSSGRDEDATKYEDLIDKIVFRLYGLSADDISIVSNRLQFLNG